MNNMLRPSWKDAPVWANYLARTNTTVWQWFESKPTYNSEFNIYWTVDKPINSDKPYPNNNKQTAKPTVKCKYIQNRLLEHRNNAGIIKQLEHS